MKCGYHGGVFARVEEIDVNDLGISGLQTGPRVNWVLDIDLPLDARLEFIWDLGT